MRLPSFLHGRRDWRAALPPKARMLVHHVDQRDLQGNVLTGYGNDFARGVFLFVNLKPTRRLEARRWMRELAEQVTPAVPWADGHKPAWTLNVALSHAGLEALGVPESVRATFPEDFRNGMNERAEEHLGDTGERHPDTWEEDLRTETHVLLTLTARTRAELSRREEELRNLLDEEDSLGELVYRQDVGLLDHPVDDISYAREHFGFADGFSQPAIKGNAGPWDRDGMGTPGKRGRWRNVAPGEFVLGYRGEDGVPPKAPAEPFARSASYMVVRKMQQRIGEFNRYLEERAGDDWGALAAKIVGRWQDGRSLVVDQDPDLEAARHREEVFPERINNFRYSDDPDGYACPLGAHVRRSNPRDDLNARRVEPTGRAFRNGFKWHGKLAKRHRIIRRGMPYPDLNQDEQKARETSADEVGLMFVCYQASIERQFELIQGKWLNDGDAFWLGGERDFLTIPQEPTEEIPQRTDWPYGYNRMTIQSKQEPRYLSPQPHFVRIRGGGYYFTPGLSALRALGSAYWL